MRLRIFSLCIVFAAALSAVAQTSYDAFKVMGEDLNGTARYVGMGGAMGAFGSDMSVISKNPAGIGTFVRSDANISLAFPWSYTDMRNSGETIDGVTLSTDGAKSRSDFRVGVENVSFVLVLPAFSEQSLKNVNLGFSYHRTRDLYRNLCYQDDFFDKQGYAVMRDLVDNQRNRINAFDFNVSFNHDDCFYWGLTFEALNSYYRGEGYFYDYFPKQSGFPKKTDYTSLDRLITMSGSGWNVKGGIIVRPAAGGFRMGLSVSTPSFYRLSESYTDYLYARDGVKKDGKEFYQNVSYRLTTPWVFNASLGYSGGRNAVGLEYEYNASGATALSIGSQKIYTQGGNKHYKSYSVLRAGYETNIDKLSLRLGYNYTFPRFRDDAVRYRGAYDDEISKFTGDTYFNEDRCDWEFENVQDAHTFTAGLGYCSAPDAFGAQFYIDGAFVYNMTNSEFNVGEYVNDPYAKLRTNAYRIILTFGVSF